MRPITPIEGNTQKLDGGAMFGHVPKALWSQWMQPDESNRISLACRGMLIQDSHKNILLETGIGAFFDPALRERYGVAEEKHVLLESLNKVGLSDADIDIVILSHLHFDHAGGLLAPWQKNSAPQLLFPNAKFLVSKTAWERACHPHMRDRASFIPELNKLLLESNRLVTIDSERCDLLGDHYQFLFTDGHTPGLMHTIIETNDGPLIFASDLIPATPWVHLPVVMGYDRAAELVVDEKKAMLEMALERGAQLFYTHDPKVVMSGVARDEKGRFLVVDGVQ